MGVNGEATTWYEERLGKLVEYRKGFAFKSSEYESVGHPVVRVSNLTDYSVDMNGCTYIGPHKVCEYKEVQLNAGDVVIATVGSGPQNPGSLVGQAIRVPDDADGGCGSE